METRVEFEYKGINAQSRTVKGLITAASEQDAARKLEEQKIRIEFLSRRQRKLFKERKRAVRLDELAVFSRQLATMVGAGMPLLQCLYALEEQASSKVFRNALKGIIKGIEGGDSLSEAIAQHKNIFANLYVSMVRAGEASGMLSEILERVAEFMEQAYALAKKIKSALMYPTIVTAMAAIITLFLVVKVIPIFATIYADFGADLPFITKLLIKASEIIRGYFIYIAAGLTGLVFLIRNAMRTPQGKILYDTVIFKIPIVGIVAKKIIMLRFAKTLGVLIKSGVPILQSLDIVSETVNNVIIKNVILATKNRVKEGEPLSEPLKKHPVFPPMVVRMIAIGEKTGKLDLMLEKISEFYQQEVNATIAGLTSLIEPLLIAFLGVVIGGIVISVFLPIFKMSTIINA